MNFEIGAIYDRFPLAALAVVVVPIELTTKEITISNSSWLVFRL